MPVEILGCGLNAHGQLNSSQDDDSTNDIFEFTSILKADSAKVLYAGWSDTLISYQSSPSSPEQLLLLGHTTTPIPITLPPNTPLHNFFGTHPIGLHGALSTTTDQLHLFSPSTATFLPHGSPDPSSNPRISHLAITSTSRLALAIRTAPASHLTHVLEFRSPAALAAWYADPSADTPDPPTHHMLGGRCAGLVATATCFFFLSEAGDVWTWGDARHGRVLGRAVGEEHPAEKPAKVSALEGVPLRRVVGGGYVGAAVSREGDAYVWGQGRAGGKGVVKALEGEDEDVKLVEVQGGRDVVDVAVGSGHVVVVVEGGGVVVAGEAENGQLGLGKECGEWVADWKSVGGLDGKVLAAVCGARTSFLVLQTP